MSSTQAPVERIRSANPARVAACRSFGAEVVFADNVHDAFDLGDPRATLFYPFGGPDLLSAAQFFPAASSYVLVGLEPPGRIPRLAELL